MESEGVLSKIDDGLCTLIRLNPDFPNSNSEKVSCVWYSSCPKLLRWRWGHMKFQRNFVWRKRIKPKFNCTSRPPKFLCGVAGLKVVPRHVPQNRSTHEISPKPNKLNFSLFEIKSGGLECIYHVVYTPFRRRKKIKTGKSSENSFLWTSRQKTRHLSVALLPANLREI